MVALTDSPSAILQKFFFDQNVFQVPGGSSTIWPLYDSYLPDIEELPGLPDFLDNTAAVFDAEGLKDGRFMLDGAGETYFHFGFQVMVRSSSKQNAWSKAQTVIQYLDAIDRTGVTIGSVVYVLHSALTTAHPTYLGIDTGSKRRRLYTVNARVTIEVAGNTVPFAPPIGGSMETVRYITNNYSLLTSDSGTFFATVGAIAEVDFQLPVWAEGLVYSFYNATTNLLKVLAYGSDHVRLGVNSGTWLQSSNNGAFITVAAVSPGIWSAQVVTSNWSVGP